MAEGSPESLPMLRDKLELLALSVASLRYAVKEEEQTLADVKLVNAQLLTRLQFTRLAHEERRLRKNGRSSRDLSVAEVLSAAKSIVKVEPSQVSSLQL